MTLPNTSLIRKLTLFLAAAMLSVSAMAADFSQNQRLANQGNAAAQYNLGVMYYKGDGIPQNQSKAIEWFQRAAAQGHIKAESNLKVMSTNAAVEILRKAANQEETVFIKNDDRCRPLATLSEGIMDARQSGYSIVEALKAAEDTNGGNVEFYKAIVVAAYSEPKYTTKEDQKNASIEFGIRGYLSCLNALS